MTQRTVLRRAAAWPFRAAIRAYRYCISPLTKPSCRYMPTCSQYGLQAIEKHGVVKGCLLTGWRILRCNPFGGCGYDPVPDEFGRRGFLPLRNGGEHASHTGHKKSHPETCTKPGHEDAQ